MWWRVGQDLEGGTGLAMSLGDVCLGWCVRGVIVGAVMDWVLWGVGLASLVFCCGIVGLSVLVLRCVSRCVVGPVFSLPAFGRLGHGNTLG